MSENNNWKVRTLIASGIIGAVMGILAGVLYVRMAEESGGPKKVSTGNVLKLALSAAGVVRQAAQLGG
jgi:hypothetical protein